MPELPDVEQFRKYFNKYGLNKKIKDIQILDTTTLRVSSKKLKQALIGHKFLKTKRRGKFLEVMTSGPYSLVLHFGMTGHLENGKAKEPWHRFTRLNFLFEDKTRLQYVSMRQLGKIYLVPDEEFDKIKTISEMGPEPLEKNFTFEKFKKLCLKRKREVKPLLLDQSFVAGLGNIYADEILFQAKIRPTRKINSLNQEELKKLYISIKKVLIRALEVNAHTRKMGKYYIIPHRYTDQKCPKCKTKLNRIRQVNRSSFFCPKCQK